MNEYTVTAVVNSLRRINIEAETEEEAFKKITEGEYKEYYSPFTFVMGEKVDLNSLSVMEVNTIPDEEVQERLEIESLGGWDHVNKAKTWYKYFYQKNVDYMLYDKSLTLKDIVTEYEDFARKYPEHLSKFE